MEGKPGCEPWHSPTHISFHSLLLARGSLQLKGSSGEGRTAAPVVYGLRPRGTDESHRY